MRSATSAGSSFGAVARVDEVVERVRLVLVAIPPVGVAVLLLCVAWRRSITSRSVFSRGMLIR